MEATATVQERISTVVSILSVSPPFKEKDIKGKIAKLPQFQNIAIKCFTSRQLKQIKKATVSAQMVRDLFIENEFCFPFQPEVLDAIRKFKTEDVSLTQFLALVSLYSYISFVLQIEKDNNQAGLCQLFNGLSVFASVDFQDVVAKAMNDVLGVIYHSLCDRVFEYLFPTLSDYFLFNKSATQTHFLMLPLMLQFLAQRNGYTTDSNAGRLSSLISILLLDHKEKFCVDAIDLLFQVIQPFLYQLNEMALVIFTNMKPFIRPDVLVTFFADLPLLFTPFVEDGQPLFELSPRKECESFEPYLSPENLFRFGTIETFKDGFDLKKVSQCPVPDITDLCSKNLVSVIDLLMKTVICDVSFRDSLLESFDRLLVDKKASKYYMDYVGLLVRLWMDLSAKEQQMPALKVPDKLFDSRYTVMREGDSKRLFSLRFFAIGCLLRAADSPVDQLMLSIVGTPVLFAEVVELCLLHIDQFAALLLRNHRIVRVIRMMALQLQYHQLKSGSTSKEIENARLSLFRLLFHLFQDVRYLEIFLADPLFLSFFMSLLFERNVREFVLRHIRNYMLAKIENPNFNICLMQIVEQIPASFPDERAFLLETDLFETINRSKLFVSALLPLCEIVEHQLDQLDGSDEARKLVMQFMLFLTSVSKLRTLSVSVLGQLEIALMKFENLGFSEYQALVSLLAGDVLASPDPKFEIKNGYILNILFKCYGERQDIDVIEFAGKLCYYSSQNCIACNQSGFDLVLLDYILSNRDRDNQKITDILLVFSTIACVISSPVVVRRFISLFIPIETRYVSSIHHLLLQPLQLIFTRAQESPVLCLPFTQLIMCRLPSLNGYSLRNGFTFICWMNFEGGSVTPIMSLCDEQHEYLSLSINGTLFAINGQTTVVQVPRRRWSLIALTYANESLILYHDSQPVCTCQYKLPSISSSLMTKIVGAKQSEGRLGNFGLFQTLSLSQLSSIFKMGPRTIRKHGVPIFYHTAETPAVSLANYTLNGDMRTFTDILLKFFKVEVLIPLFAQLDLTLKDGGISHFTSIDVVSVLSAALYVGEREQMDFYHAHGFSIIAHLLVSASAKQVSYDVYLTFFRIFENLICNELRDELFTQILLNFDIWIQCSHSEQLRILKHWSGVLSVTYSALFLEYMPFSLLLEKVRMYYWYEPVEFATIRGDWDSSRPRAKDIDVTACREILFDILMNISTHQFKTEDFEALFNHAITVIDKPQKLDILRFLYRLVTAEHRPLRSLPDTDRFYVFTRIHFLMNNISDNGALLIVKVISAIHKYTTITEMTLATHIQIVFNAIMKKPATMALLDGCMDLMVNNDVPELFPYCALMADQLDVMTMYQELEPSEKYVTCNTWMLYSVMAAVQRPGADCECILAFLSKCSLHQWFNLMQSIRICCVAVGSDTDDIASRFLSILCLSVLNIQETLPNSIIEELFSMIRFHIFFRRRYVTSEALMASYRASPYGSGDSLKMSKRSASLPLTKPNGQLESIISKGIDTPEYTFGLRIENGKWLDSNLAMYAMKLTTKYRSPVSVSFGIIVAAFLIEVNFEYVYAWLSEMGLMQDEIDANYMIMRLLMSKAIKVNKPFPYRGDKADIVRNAAKVVSELPAMFDMIVASGISTVAKNFRETMRQCQTVVRKIFTAEANENADECVIHMSKLMEQTRRNFEANSKLWQRLWSNVVVDNAPWDPSRIYTNDVSVKWKRDMAICHHCPIRMKRNKRYTRHVDASISRDAGNLSSAEHLLREYRENLELEYRQRAPPEILEVPTMPVEEIPVSVYETQPAGKSKEQIAFNSECEVVKMRRVRTGTFKVLTDSARIIVRRKIKVIEFRDIRAVLMRRRFHHPTAIEIFLIDGTSYFLNFPQYRSIDVIRRMNLPDSVVVQRQDFPSFVSSLPLTQKWADGEISNFDYLMQLNLITGRSFNDASQYPFFPWVISDYESETLDLSSPNTFRDLTKPIGAIGEDRFSELKQRMHDMRQFHSVPYMYSSFAICPLSIYLWFLRIEPFASLHIEMQSNKFDHPSRLFSSVADTYKLVTGHLNDYRELPPEFYFQPEWVYNDNEFDLGQAHGKVIDKVVLPPWAHDSGPEFCYLMRKAFESDYVSENLNHWIDLFFGYKQTGKEAAAAYNVYSPDMYESAWTSKTRKDPLRRAEIEAAMCHVGQLPPRVFSEPHPPRKVRTESSALLQRVIVDLTCSSIATAYVRNTGKQEIILFSDHVLTWFSVNIGSDVAVTKGVAMSVSENIVSIHFSKEQGVIAMLGTGKLLPIENGNMSQLYRELVNVSCVMTSGEYVAVISDEATLNLFGPRLKYAIPFFGDAISCCDVSKEFGVAVVGTISGSIVTCSLFNGTKVNVVNLGSGFRPLRTIITKSWGFIITHASNTVNGKTTNYLFVHNVNGRLIRMVPIKFSITAWYTWSSRKGFDYLIIANEQGKLWVVEAFYLNIGESLYRCYETIVSLSYLQDSHVAVAVSQEGHAIFIPLIVE